MRPLDNLEFELEFEFKFDLESELPIAEVDQKIIASVHEHILSHRLMTSLKYWLYQIPSLGRLIFPVYTAG